MHRRRPNSVAGLVGFRPSKVLKRRFSFRKAGFRCRLVHRRSPADGGRRAQPLRRFINDHISTSLGEDVFLLNQVAGVRGNDSVTDAQVDDALHQLRIFAVQPDLSQQMADSAGGPQAGDKGIAAVCAEAQIPVFKDLLFTVHIAGQGDGCRTAFAVTTGNHQLRAGKEVRQIHRI